MSVSGGWFAEESFVCSSSASLVAAQYCAVSLTTALGTGGQSTGVGTLPIVILTASATQGINGAIGILQNDPKVTQAAIVRFLGSSKMVATTSAAIVTGNQITSTTAGQAMVADTSGQRVLGIALSGSTTLLAGALIEVLLPAPHSLGLM